MTGFFIWILQSSIAASFVAAVLLLVRIPLRRRPKRYAYALWAILLLRLMLPVSLASPLSMLPRSVAAPVFLEMPVAEAGTPMGSRAAVWTVPWASLEGGVKDFGLLEAATLLYFGGLLVSLLRLLLHHRQLQRKMLSTKQVEEGVFEGNAIGVPFAYGVLRKRVYLPADLSPWERGHILAHEKIHLKRQDPLLRGVGYVVLLFHWFNPVLWMAYVLMIRDMEMSCDEAVLKDCSKEEKGAYAKALLRVAEGSTPHLAMTGYAFGDVGRRIRNIFSFKSTTRREKGAFALVFLLALLLLLTNPTEDVSRNVERTLRDPKPVENIFGDHLEVFEEGERMFIGRRDHVVDETFDKEKPLSMQGLRKEFLDEETGMMVHESLHFKPGDTILVQDFVNEVFYDEAQDATFLTFFADDGYQEYVGFQGDLMDRFGPHTSKMVQFKFQVLPLLSYSDRFQILDYNRMREDAGAYPEVDPFLP